MITPQQFKQHWEGVEGDRLATFPPQSLSDVRLPANAKDFLVEAGLPESAAPCLNFEPPENGTLQRVSAVWHQPSTFDHYRIIGSNDSGDPICLDEQVDGQVVYLSHDNYFERVLMASSVFTLAECLVHVRDVIANAGGDCESVATEHIDELFERLRITDPAACGTGAYWRQELRNWQQELKSLQPARRKTWWQFWK